MCVHPPTADMQTVPCLLRPSDIKVEICALAKHISAYPQAYCIHFTGPGPATEAQSQHKNEAIPGRVKNSLGLPERRPLKHSDVGLSSARVGLIRSLFPPDIPNFSGRPRAREP